MLYRFSAARLVSCLGVQNSWIELRVRYAGYLAPVRISLPVDEIYMISGPTTLAALWRQKWLSSPIFAYTVGLKYIFGMREESIRTYKADNSGVYQKPHPDSNVEPRNRLDYLTHNGLLKGLAKEGLGPLLQRFEHNFRSRLSSLGVTEEWVEMPDLLEFFEQNVGNSILEALFGPTLLTRKNFLRDLWDFDRGIRFLGKRFPWFLAPKAHRARDRMLAHLQAWYIEARKGFTEASILPDGDGDPFWGSELVRSRQRYLLAADEQDDAAVSSVDLGLLWTSVTNIVPNALLTILHVFEDQELQSKLRQSLANLTKRSDGVSFNVEDLLQDPLMNSVYAETLRLHVHVFTTRCSPHQDFTDGRWFVPRNKVFMVNSYPAHMDNSYWNTKDGKHPLNTFWAERFILDPSDPLSGPRKDGLSHDDLGDKGIEKAGEKLFTLKGLDGAWIPYGGGYGACPGRHLARRQLLLIMATMLSMFDVEFLTPNITMDTSGFGIATEKPKQKVKFRMRKRVV
ncbi:cytochrome P450 [Pseudovirgaria hyperparasitica]|uniref:Cytochrome P450 n=1 Tax=Pseudovirgaria hyperparasitica TaxID=470096 RepID=A0A6A6W3V2_9PEZI|nr:cytochrome P450 [Pseudovirgaria hyperparasitica]KAF2756237.1 cytochrome P450 [Pseudovirgaria hyperparasitica]